MAQQKKPAKYDIDYVRQAASARAFEVLVHVAGINPDLLDGNHHPCPKCGGTDRFRFNVAKGFVICNQCFNNGNGDTFAATEWMTGHKFGQVLGDTAEFLGIAPLVNSHAKKSESANPAEHLKWLPWNEFQVARWCLKKQPITPAAIASVGGKLARYRGDYTVIALPVWGEKLDAAEPVGWCLYNITGGPLPKFVRQKVGDKEQTSVEWVKVKLAFGSKPGVMGDLARIRTAKELWKVEGPSDMLAFQSLADLPPDAAALTNANGCGEQPSPWMVALFADKLARVAHDADVPGQNGAVTYTDQRGRERVGWANYLATTATECRNVLLPFPIAETHGKDIRDYFNEGKRYRDLAQLAAAATPIGAEQQTITTKPIEADDDPHRLARVNLERYAMHAQGATLRYWRNEWYTWKPSRGCYRVIDEAELRAKITQSIKQEFDRLNILDQQENSSDKPPEARKVTKALVTNVLNATAGMVCVPSSVELMTWLDDDRRERRNYVAMANGILDLDRLLEGRPDDKLEDILIPHSPQWFSTVRLPYAFNKDAKCPKWDAFLEKNLEMDPERIKLLQEWAGYLLLPDTGMQKFLVMEGEGANGKSVYCAAIAAMLGTDNCEHIPLEVFGDQFSKTQTIGKLVNICADVGEIDKVAEGFLKSFVSGDTVFFNRKGIKGISCAPTARLMIACNNRPRFSDRSSGIWRRMLLVPWRVQIGERERVPNMDKPWWWERQSELPGIFLWAVLGLHRLRQQGRFTESMLSKEALEDYQAETNPARAFLMEHFEANQNMSVRTESVYHFYIRWAERNGYRPLSERVFGKEVKRTFPHVERKRGGGRSDRYWNYAGISYSVEEICGEKVEPEMLF